MYFVFMPASVKRAAPASVAENDAVMLKGAGAEFSLLACFAVDVSVAESARLERLHDPVAQPVGVGVGVVSGGRCHNMGLPFGVHTFAYGRKVVNG